MTAPMLSFSKKILRFLAYFLFPLFLLLKLLKVRIFELNYMAIGHLSMEPDVLIKYLRINKKSYKIFCFVRKERVANTFLLNYWKKYFFIISNPFLRLMLWPFTQCSYLKIHPASFFATSFSSNYHPSLEATNIYKKYHRIFGEITQSTSLIQLSKSENEKGFNILLKWGLKKGDWFVCFHNRDGAFHESSSNWDYCRNSSLENLDLALKEIIHQGGWCIRMGSSKTKPLPEVLKMEKVIDYPHSEFCSDFMDIFLVSRCKFFLGNNSGLTALANVCGTPCACNNVVPFGMLTLFEKDLVIFKLQKFKNSNQLLPFIHCLHSWLSTSIHAKDYEKYQIELIENSAEEIKELTQEMLNKIIKKPNETPQQKLFKDMLTPNNLHYKSPASVGSHFLKKYNDLLKR